MLQQNRMTDKEESDRSLPAWQMFSTTHEEIKEMMRSHNEVTIHADAIMITHCLFRPSAAYPEKLIPAHEIRSIDINGFPPNIRVDNELIYITAEKKEDLKLFAAFNNIPVIDRPDVWSWLLEPFLDTEYTAETHQRIIGLLAQYGLDEITITGIRQEVEEQMLRYNFDTTLWEWVHLNLYDVLKAMRTKYDDSAFNIFYKRAMRIALLPDDRL